MGEMADYYLEQYESYYHVPRRAVQPARPGHWTTRTGRTLEIRKMDDEHLENSIAMIYRHAMGGFVDKYHELVAEQRRRSRNESQHRRRRQKLLYDRAVEAGIISRP